MRKLSPIAIAFLAMTTSALAEDAATKAPMVAAPIEQCIRENAPKVEIAVSELNAAVGFLVDKICAEPVASENTRLATIQQEKMAAYWQKMCDDQKAAKGGDAEKNNNSKAIGANYCAMGKIGFAGLEQYLPDDESGPVYMGSGSPAAVALASRLLLDLRLSHKKPDHKN